MLRYEKAPECLFENCLFHFRRRNSKQGDYWRPPRYHDHLSASPRVGSLDPRGMLYTETRRPARRMLEGVKYDTHMYKQTISYKPMTSGSKS